MGFAPDVRRILGMLPRERQTLFFSATMPFEAKRLADGILRDPARVEVAPPATTVESVAQSVFFVSRADKARLLEHLLADDSIPRALVFTRTKRGADRLARTLVDAGIDADAIHGNKSQGRRERTLDAFRSGGTRVLVATDIAARGLDVEGISHVINYELPNEPESYVHRIGRTARAGAAGVALSFCDPSEEGFLRDIERAIRVRLGVVEDHPFRRARPAPRPVAPVAPSLSHVGWVVAGRGRRRR
jgi:ATP-dependent RNA helicase RhlE